MALDAPEDGVWGLSFSRTPGALDTGDPHTPACFEDDDAGVAFHVQPPASPSCQTHHRRPLHAGLTTGDDAPGLPFMCSPRRPLHAGLTTGDDAPGLPFVCSPRRPLHAGLITGDDAPALPILCAAPFYLHHRRCPDKAPAHREALFVPVSPSPWWRHGLAGSRRHLLSDWAPSSAPPLLPTPSAAPGRGSAASRGLPCLCLAGPWRRHGLAGT
ncbi:hypothetical protein VPH35_137949 [Triticum aestivum]